MDGGLARCGSPFLFYGGAAIAMGIDEICRRLYGGDHARIGGELAARFAGSKALRRFASGEC